MGITGGEALALVRAVIDAGVVAIAAVPAGLEDLARRRGPDRRSTGGRQVNARVELPALVERVVPHAEVAGLPPVHGHRQTCAGPDHRSPGTGQPTDFGGDAVTLGLQFLVTL